jgi:hypothetical protein
MDKNEFVARVIIVEGDFESCCFGKTKDGKINVKLKAEVNQLLFNWVVSFSNVAHVKKPAALRSRLKEFAEYLTETYG